MTLCGIPLRSLKFPQRDDQERIMYRTDRPD